MMALRRSREVQIRIALRADFETGPVSALRGFADITSAQDDERQFRFGRGN
jgi:hypothetical protein